MSSGLPETRERILRAAFELLEQTLDPSISMSRIAERAGVSRQAVYLHFESRTRLFLDMVDWSDGEMGLDDELAALSAIEDPVDRLFEGLRIGARFEPRIAEITLAFEVSRHNDEAVQAAWNDRMGRRLRGYTAAMTAVQAAGRLRPGLTTKQAAEAVWHISCPASYRNLVVERGWPHDVWTQWMIDTIERSLLC